MNAAEQPTTKIMNQNIITTRPHPSSCTQDAVAVTNNLDNGIIANFGQETSRVATDSTAMVIGYPLAVVTQQTVVSTTMSVHSATPVPVSISQSEISNDADEDHKWLWGIVGRLAGGTVIGTVGGILGIGLGGSAGAAAGTVVGAGSGMVVGAGTGTVVGTGAGAMAGAGLGAGAGLE
ncbi:hypothetical protein BDD12DRAFT_112032 [Trichophaea hybrida]|nr:hypothetical protein BDD12DRAFT_112032 [Trichophaea hybrida]